MNKHHIDLMLIEWAKYYLSEFNTVNWGKISMSGKIIEVARLGVFSKGTGHNQESYIPEHIEITANAIGKLKPSEQLIIKEEYTGKGNQKAKAKRKHMTLCQYKSKLHRTRQKLFSLFDRSESIYYNKTNT